MNLQTMSALTALFNCLGNIDPACTPERCKSALDAACSIFNGGPVDKAPSPAGCYSPKEVCKLGGCERHTVARWAREGKIKAVRTGSRGERVTGYTKASVDDFLAGRSAKEVVS